MDEPHVLSLLGNNRQLMSVCAKMISSWPRKVLGIAKAQISLGTLQSIVVLATFAGSVCLVSILEVGDSARVYTQARHLFPTFVTTADQYQDYLQHACLGLSE